MHNMRHYMNLVEDILMEAQDYSSMFNDIRKITHDYDQQIKDGIANAVSLMKKNDRIVWYLRLWKIGLIISKVDNIISKTEFHSQLKELLMKLQQEYSRKAGRLPSVISSNASAIFSTYNDDLFRHYLSLPIPAIQNKVFAINDTTTSILDEFELYDEKWRAASKELIPYDPDDGHILHRFSDGMYWKLLDRPSCPDEGRAMGHCGNTGNPRYDHRILSLRSLVKKDGKTFERPSLTFIIDRDGRLGEMKGRGNEKPNPKYHSHIISLLKSSLVTGIDGGGYKPENNFAISDLTPDQQADIMNTKPSLMGDFMFERDGYQVFMNRAMNDEYIKTFNLYYAHNGILTFHLSMDDDNFNRGLSLPRRFKYPDELEPFIKRSFEEMEESYDAKIDWRNGNIPLDLNYHYDDFVQAKQAIIKWDQEDAYDLAAMIREAEYFLDKLPEDIGYEWFGEVQDGIGSWDVPFDVESNGATVIAFDKHGDWVDYETHKIVSLHDFLMNYYDDSNRLVAYYMWVDDMEPTEENARETYIKKIYGGNTERFESDLEDDDIDLNAVVDFLNDQLEKYGPYEK